ncbi:hypothetical protein OR16_04542 [Cupriavidus basilensis OR16]|uniref:Uncharacterized protein n=2 Tax=Cupriavidus basilensis TaxID=68895 RepID=H1S000_9BURK|nr:hypothetical protein OR16_04542 [Cupriavidus basilensis OR16]
MGYMRDEAENYQITFYFTVPGDATQEQRDAAAFRALKEAASEYAATVKCISLGRD